MSEIDDCFPSPEEAPSVLEARFDNPPKLAMALAESIAEDLRIAVEERGQATLVVSGGSTPVLLFQHLSRQFLNWTKVTVLLTDERWVPAEHEESNEALVRRHLLVGEAEEAGFVGLKNGAETPEDGWRQCEAALGEIPRPYDVVVLGMGEDGHTASLFPRAPELEIGLDPGTDRLCLPVPPPREAANGRISLTLGALLDCRRCILHFTGDAKWRVYRRALREVPVTELPVRAVLGKAREPIDVYWAP